MSRRAVLPLVVASLLLAGCAGTATGEEARSGGPEQRIEVEVAGGEVSGDTGRVQVDAGAPVSLTVTSDVADEVHVHGYDVESELEPGTPAELRFDATTEGVFEVELHEAGTVLLTLQVS